MSKLTIPENNIQCDAVGDLFEFRDESLAPTHAALDSAARHLQFCEVCARNYRSDLSLAFALSARDPAPARPARRRANVRAFAACAALAICIITIFAAIKAPPAPPSAAGEFVARTELTVVFRARGRAESTTHETSRSSQTYRLLSNAQNYK
ncbi:MAG: hypothetical protein HY286_02500 [Planctomycetes bacterium]|nr:hypothetical protein [Planctomycetota bacterium]